MCKKNDSKEKGGKKQDCHRASHTSSAQTTQSMPRDRPTLMGLHTQGIALILELLTGLEVGVSVPVATTGEIEHRPDRMGPKWL